MATDVSCQRAEKPERISGDHIAFVHMELRLGERTGQVLEFARVIQNWKAQTTSEQLSAPCLQFCFFSFTVFFYILFDYILFNYILFNVIFCHCRCAKGLPTELPIDPRILQKFS